MPVTMPSTLGLPNLIHSQPIQASDATEALIRLRIDAGQAAQAREDLLRPSVRELLGAKLTEELLKLAH